MTAETLSLKINSAAIEVVSGKAVLHLYCSSETWMDLLNSAELTEAAIDDRPVKDIQRTESSQDFAAIHNALPQVVWHIET